MTSQERIAELEDQVRSQAERIAALKADYANLNEMYQKQGLEAFKPWKEQKSRAEAAESLLAEAREALTSADEWMSCVEPHLRDGHTFKRDRAAIRATLSRLKPGEKRGGE